MSGTFMAERVFIGLADPSIVAGMPLKILLAHLGHVNYQTDSKASAGGASIAGFAMCGRGGQGPLTPGLVAGHRPALEHAWPPLPNSQKREKEDGTPHLASYVGHPIPRGEGISISASSLTLLEVSLCVRMARFVNPVRDLSAPWKTSWLHLEGVPLAAG
jgi:hypothetical protein